MIAWKAGLMVSTLPPDARARNDHTPSVQRYSTATLTDSASALGLSDEATPEAPHRDPRCHCTSKAAGKADDAPARLTQLVTSRSGDGYLDHMEVVRPGW
jgi:hypothetical protein